MATKALFVAMTERYRALPVALGGTKVCVGFDILVDNGDASADYERSFEGG